MGTFDILVVGSGHGGTHAAATLRSHGFTGSIGLAAAEDEPAYQRPPLSKAYLSGDMGRERILLRACIQIANGNLRLRMQKPHAASRLFGEALDELHTLSARKAAEGAGDGFADGFPTAELATLLKAKTAKSELSKADWVAFSAIGRT